MGFPKIQPLATNRGSIATQTQRPSLHDVCVQERAGQNQRPGMANRSWPLISNKRVPRISCEGRSNKHARVGTTYVYESSHHQLWVVWFPMPIPSLELGCFVMLDGRQGTEQNSCKNEQHPGIFLSAWFLLVRIRPECRSGNPGRFNGRRGSLLIRK